MLSPPQLASINNQQQQFYQQKLNQYQKYNHITVNANKPYLNKQIDTRWVQLKINGNFISRSYFASCIQAGKVFIHGGYNQQIGILNNLYQSQFYSLPTQWKQLNVSSKKQNNPPALRNHTLCAYKSYLILFGGQKSMLENNQKIYRFDLRTSGWQILKIKVKDSAKINIAIDSHVAFIHNNNMYIFGGYYSELGLYSNSFIKVNLENISIGQVEISQVQNNNSDSPSSRGNLAGTLCGDNYYIFGGTNSNQTFDDFWMFSFINNRWQNIIKKNQQWPQKRKGQTMNYYQKFNSIFMFGGIKQITKQKNDMMVFVIQKQKWVRIHQNTNLLYDPSPTLKKQIENSPSIIQAKNYKLNQTNSKKNKYSSFKIGLRQINLKNRTFTQSFSKEKQSNKNNLYNKQLKTEYEKFSNLQSPLTKKTTTLVQEKKFKDFQNRKKKLLQQIHNNSKNLKDFQRPHSPTSQTLIYSIDTIGEQKKQTSFNDDELPKVIFEEQKGAVIGKKPCARDGHGGLLHQDSIIIIGGDRHMISFKDVYLFKMDKAIQNIHLYE